MKINPFILASAFVGLFAHSTWAEVPPDTESNPQERHRAQRQVEKDKKVLSKKLRQKASPQAIHEAKAKLQTDRVEKNREDYKHGIIEGKEGGNATH